MLASNILQVICIVHVIRYIREFPPKGYKVTVFVKDLSLDVWFDEGLSLRYFVLEILPLCNAIAFAR